ncbi:MAG: PH domain-containing protein [Acidimicrobiia bacterium]|jgi:uncharacterized membrane protein YdbT with pleckstrin-like domain
MGYPERLLSDDEVIESQFRPHWSGIIREGLVVLAGIAVAILLAVFEMPSWSYAIVAVAVLVLITRGLVRWFTTLHVITNERLIYRAGLIAKKGTEIPLEVIQDVAFNQSIFERVFGTGDLVIESAGEHGQTRYQDIPGPEAVQSLIYRVREARVLEMESGGSVGRPESTASQLETLSRLHDEGKLTDAEFEAEKEKLIGGAS